MSLNESIVEDAALTWFGQLGYAVGHGAVFAELRRAKPSLAPGEPAASACASRADRRDSLGEVVQYHAARTFTRLLPAGEDKRDAIRRLNPAIPDRSLM